MRFKPILNKAYYVVDYDFNVIRYIWFDDSIDNQAYKVGNCFKTKKLALSAAKALKARLTLFNKYGYIG